MHAIAFIIVNFAPIMIALCNIVKFHYIEVFDSQTLARLSKTDINILTALGRLNVDSDNENAKNLIEESDESLSNYYIPQHIPVVIILGIFQLAFIVLCIILLKIRSWGWIKKSKLNNNKKGVHIIYQLEETLFIITISFLGIWISEIYILHFGKSGTYFGLFFGVISDIFGIISVIPIFIVFSVIRKRSKILYSLFYFASLFEVAIIIVLLYKYYDYFVSLYEGNSALSLSSNMFYREIVTFGTPTVLFLIILNINTILCQKYIDEKFISQTLCSENKPILITRSIISFKKFLGKSFKKFLKFLGKKPDLELDLLNINEWKFKPKTEISLLEIVSIKIDNNNENNEAIDVESDIKNTLERKCVEISFNTESDVMIQTNYPLSNSFVKDTSSTTLSISVEYYYYEMTILSNQNIDETIIAIGFASKNHSIDRLPGCDIHSVGFHSDEGKTFHNEGYTGSKYAEKWGNVNDVIGCGYCPSTGQVFFTMNGKNLGIAYAGLFHTWYPTIGSNGVCSLKVNFGQEEFRYNEANDMSITRTVFNSYF